MTRPAPLSDEAAAALKLAVDAIRHAGRIELACHIDPDGDALGSILSLALALPSIGIEVTAGWGSDDNTISPLYSYLPGTDRITPASNFKGDTLCVSVDCASADRLGMLQEPFESGTTLINIDHHLSNTNFGTLNVVDPLASSTCEMALHLILDLGAEINPDVATCLYTGIVTDTGRFCYASVSPRTHAAAGFLIDQGVRVDAISQSVFESQPYGYLKVLGRVLERAQLMDDPPLVVSWVTRSDLDFGGIAMAETEELINVLRSVQGADAAALLKEQSDGRWKASLRSKGAADVSVVAQSFGGGGHKLAAGFTSDLSRDETVKAIHQLLRSGATAK